MEASLDHDFFFARIAIYRTLEHLPVFLELKYKRPLSIKHPFGSLEVVDVSMVGVVVCNPSRVAAAAQSDEVVISVSSVQSGSVDTILTGSASNLHVRI